LRFEGRVTVVGSEAVEIFEGSCISFGLLRDITALQHLPEANVVLTQSSVLVHTLQCMMHEWTSSSHTKVISDSLANPVFNILQSI
jgi:hypothetical protein